MCGGQCHHDYSSEEAKMNVAIIDNDDAELIQQLVGGGGGSLTQVDCEEAVARKEVRLSSL